MKKVLTTETDLLIAPLRDVLVTYRDTPNALVKKVLFTRLRKTAKNAFIKVGEMFSAHDIADEDIAVDVEAHDMYFVHQVGGSAQGITVPWPTLGTILIRLSVPTTSKLSASSMVEWMHAMDLAVGGEVPGMQIVFALLKRGGVTEPVEEA